MVLVVIPARGGSKGILNKNVQPVGGVPLVARSVRAARASSVVDRVIVSTDDQQIAQVAADAGAEIVDRPTELAGDHATTESAVLHCLQVMLEQDARVPPITLILQCTAPLIRSQDLDAGLDLMGRSRADVVFSARPFHGFLWRVEPDGSAVAENHDWRIRPRRQDLEPRMLETGAFYGVRTAGFLAAKHRFFGRVVAHEVPVLRSIDIDTVEDLQIASALLEIAGE